MNPVQSQEVKNEVAGTYAGKVSTTVVDPFTGKKLKAIGEYSLPQATDSESLDSLSKGDISEVIFWYNFGRKVAARAQVAAKLGFDLGSPELNDLFSSFMGAMDQLVGKDGTQEQRDAFKGFVLAQAKFKPLAEALENYTPGSVNVDFATEELKKPSGKKGRPAASGNNTSADSEDESED